MKSLVFALLFTCLLGCSSAPHARTNYLLRSERSQELQQEPSLPVAYLGVLELANYLDQSGIVTESAPGEIHLAKTHQWAEPLKTSLRSFLAAEISYALEAPVAKHKNNAPNAIRIDINVDQLHGTTDGSAVLVADWGLVMNREITLYRQAASRPLDESGYAALVAAEKALLVDLAQAIAAAMKQVTASQ